MFIRFDRVHERDRRVDEQADRHRIDKVCFFPAESAKSRKHDSVATVATVTACVISAQMIHSYTSLIIHIHLPQGMP